MLPWWAWVLLTPIILYIAFKVGIRLFLRRMMSRVDEGLDDEAYGRVDLLIVRAQADEEISPDEVSTLAAELPHHRFYVFFELANWDCEDLISDRFKTLEEQAIAAMASTLENELDEMPTRFEVIEKAEDTEGSFFLIAYGISGQEGGEGIGLAGPLDEAALPYRRKAYAFTRPGDTRKNVSIQELIHVWREDHGASRTQGLSYRYPSDPPKTRDKDVKKINV